MLLRKQSTWCGQTKEHVCVKSTPYHGSAAPPGEGPARALSFLTAVGTPRELSGSSGGWGSGREQGLGSLALSITALELAAIVQGPAGASPKLLRFHFTSSRLLGDSLGKDQSPGMLSGGGGPGLYTAVKTSRTGGSGTSARACLRLWGRRGAPQTYLCTGER